MAPAEQSVFWKQTNDIIKCLLEDDDELDRSHGRLETDGSGSDDFDPVLIADKLRQVADSMNDDIKFKAAIKDLREAAAQEAAEAAFSHGVEALCQTQVAQGPEVAPEVQLIRASVALGLFVKKTCPELRTKVRSAMAAFLNRRVQTWVDQQGGWDKVSHALE